jgi:hypothetical protein
MGSVYIDYPPKAGNLLAALREPPEGVMDDWISRYGAYINKTPGFRPPFFIKVGGRFGNRTYSFQHGTRPYYAVGAPKPPIYSKAYRTADGEDMTIIFRVFAARKTLVYNAADATLEWYVPLLAIRGQGHEIKTVEVINALEQYYSVQELGVEEVYRIFISPSIEDRPEDVEEEDLLAMERPEGAMTLNEEDALAMANQAMLERYSWGRRATSDEVANMQRTRIEELQGTTGGPAADIYFEMHRRQTIELNEYRQLPEEEQPYNPRIHIRTTAPWHIVYDALNRGKYPYFTYSTGTRMWTSMVVLYHHWETGEHLDPRGVEFDPKRNMYEEMVNEWKNAVANKTKAMIERDRRWWNAVLGLQFGEDTIPDDVYAYEEIEKLEGWEDDINTFDNQIILLQLISLEFRDRVRAKMIECPDHISILEDFDTKPFILWHSDSAGQYNVPSSEWSKKMVFPAVYDEENKEYYANNFLETEHASIEYEIISYTCNTMIHFEPILKF